MGRPGLRGVHAEKGRFMKPSSQGFLLLRTRMPGRARREEVALVKGMRTKENLRGHLQDPGVWKGLSRTLGLPSVSVVKNLPASVGYLGSIPETGRFPDKETATHSSILAWEILWTEEPGRLQTTGSQKSQA